jgi:RpiR family carbohydrate utilization transcriptional regulator
MEEASRDNSGLDQQRAERQDVIERIYRKAPYLTRALRRIAEVILEHPDQCKTMSIKDLATASHVAESTVTRFVREIGLKSYQELKMAIVEVLTLNEASSLPAQETYVYEDISRTDSVETIVDKVVYRHTQTLTETKRRLNLLELHKAVDAIEKAQTIIFCCMGSSGIAAEEGVMRFTRAGKKCLLFKDQSIQLMTSAIVSPHDVVIGISNSGYSIAVIESLKLAQSKGAQTMVITSFEDSPLVKYADIALFTPTKSPPHGPGLYWEATTSKSAQTLVIDLLCACYAVRNFDETLRFLEETFLAVRSTRCT